MSENVSVNSMISHYRITAKIGAGGMGEVYRAHDSRLDREVAIKILPSEVAKDHDRLERFEQEAKSTSALNHPNILTVYDIGEQDGVPFIVSELLEGEELRDRLNDGVLPLRKTIDFAQQIVSGVSAAHERGITHRDLKPENLFITKDDRVKILDFGLAKLRQPAASSKGSEDATKKALTDPGVVMGTVGYMSPEQVRGSAADHRSDIFSFGVILYEMLSGQRAFGGESVIETMHSILKEDVPDLEDSGIRVPPALEKLMRRCLEKKPEHRFHSAHDLGFALDAVASPTSSSGSALTVAAKAVRDVPDSASSKWLGGVVWLAAAALLVSTVVLATLYFRRVEPSAQTIRFAVLPPDKNSFNEGFAISPDGSAIVFTARNSTGVTSLWIRSLDSIDARPLAGTDGAAFPFWSPDGRTVAFFSTGKLRRIDASGGPSQSIADVSNDPRGGIWTPDGTIIFAPNTLSPLVRVPASGGAVTEVTKLNDELAQTSHRWPSLLPDGKHFLFFGRGGVVEKQGIYVTSLDDPQPTFVVASPVSAKYADVDSNGYLLFVREGTLMAQRFDTARLALSGEAIPLVDNLLIFPGEIGPTAFSAFSVSGGRLIYRSGDQQTTRLTWFDREGKNLGAINEPAGYHEPILSKDGTKVLYGRNEVSGPQDIFMQDLSRGGVTRLTFDPASDTTAIFSPDESQIIFFTNRNTTQAIYRKSASGAGSDELVWADPLGAYPDSWSQDGKYIICDKNGGSRTKVDLWILPMTGEQPYAYLATQFEEAHAQFSPDGRWVLYTSTESGRPEVYVQSFPIGAGKWQISTGGGDQAHWRADGKEIFYFALDNNLMAVPTVASGTTIEFGRPQALFLASTPISGITDDRNSYAPSRDGQRFLLTTLVDPASAQPLAVVLNWAEAVKK
jgi:eukaryotic-like serine/threonine-protein kinase